MIVVGLAVVIIALLLSGPMTTDQVELNTFAPVEIVHIADWIMAGMLVFYAFFTGVASAGSILQEEESGTLPRLFTTPTPQSTVPSQASESSSTIPTSSRESHLRRVREMIPRFPI